MMARAHNAPTLAVAWALAVLVMAVPAVADEPQEGEATEKKATTESPPEPVLKSKTPPSKGDSLAAAASRIRLKRPEGAGSSGLVITNDNLQKVGAKGNLSVSGSGPQSTTPQASGAAGSAAAVENPANAIVQEYLAQKNAVDGLETRLANFDEQLEAPPRDPHYQQSHNSPHLRAPGVQSPAQVQRDQLAKQLAEEKKKLDEIRNRARREGIQLQ